MTSVQFDALFAVAKYGSMNKAAEALFISQPALKKRLDSLERELGYPVVYREQSGCSLTEAGQILYRELLPLQGKLRDIFQKAAGAASVKKLRICQLPFLTLRYSDKVLADFHQARPEITLERVFMKDGQWFVALKNGEFDICFVPGTDAARRQWAKKGFCCIYDGIGQLECLYSGHSPVEGRDRAELEDLAGRPVFSDSLMLTSGGLLQAAEKAGLRITSARSAYNRYEVTDHCSRGALYLMDANVREDIPSLKAVPVRGFSYPRYILLRNDREPALQAFKEYLLSSDPGRKVVV